MGTTAPDDRPDVRTRVSRPRQGNAPVVLAGSGNKVIGRALEVTGLTDALPTYATAEQAVAAVST